MKKIILALIKFYQREISNYNFGCCKFIPTCSAYAYQAIERFGVIKGLILFLRRFLRCNPFFKGYGYDPVPEKFPNRFLKNKK